RAVVPVDDAVAGGAVVDVMIARRRGGGLENAHHIGFVQADGRLEFPVLDRGEEFQLLGVTEHRPGEAAGPRAERRIPLLRCPGAETAVSAVESPLVRGSAADVVRVTAVAVEDE